MSLALNNWALDFMQFSCISLPQKLTQGEANWSVSELVHALILLAHFHALCSFVYGCGISTEVDHDGGYSYRPQPVTDKNCNVEQKSNSSLSSSPEVRATFILPFLLPYLSRVLG